MGKLFTYCVAVIFIFGSCMKREETKVLLVFPETNAGESSASIASMKDYFLKNNIHYDTLAGTNQLTEENIRHYNAIIFAGAEVAVDYKKQNAIQRYIQAGGAIGSLSSIFIHPEKWPWFDRLKLEGASEENRLKYENSYPREINFEYSLSGKYDYDGGRFYFAMADNTLRENTREIIDYLVGRRPDYKKVVTPEIPDDSRFVKIVLDGNVNEPMEMDIFKDGRVIFIEREGPVKLYLPRENKTKLLAKFDVRTEGNYEDGMLGVAIDPNYERNGKIYIYYSVPGTAVQRLSRFYMSYDSLFLNTEKTILDVPVQIETCCHSGGSIQFGPDNLLYLSTGDNTSSKESDGYTPIDERPGRGPFDAQKSSGNTHDLRGKILRIKVNEDGSYSIPEGNLFPKDGSEGRPEIYVMGARNPFRISIDPRTNFLYWGDVGPDSGKDGIQGSKSYDEWNQARTPGNYGWPYFQANNIAYPDWDFETNTPGEYFDPENPVNDSPNNYGSRHLPPARPAMIWYPYDESPEWPELGTGSRSAMAGPIYYPDKYLGSENRLPEYFTGKMFIYDWARSWIKLVTFDDQHNPEKIEPFLPEIEFSKPIDMELGPDGSLYVLEYGANYFADNDEATLSKIEYAAGNRNPVASISADKVRGAVPLEVQFSGEKSYDYDAGDQLTYHWEFPGTGDRLEGREVQFVFNEPGKYTPRLTIKDAAGASATTTIEIFAGNAAPEINVKFGGNSSFYFKDKISYEVAVTDIEDQDIAENNINIRFEYLSEGFDEALLGGSLLNPHQKGMTLINNSDCKSCHDISKPSIGPSYEQIAERYDPTPENIEYLGTKIIEGGNGNWGHSLMAAHPQHSMEETEEMVKYILAIGEEQTGTMESKGYLSFNKHRKDQQGRYYFAVSYTDGGANGMPPIRTQETAVFRSPRVEAEDYEMNEGVHRIRPQGGNLSYIANTQQGHYLGFRNIDLSGITSIDFNMTATPVDAKIVIRRGGPDGEVVGEKMFKAENGSREFSVRNIALNSVSGVDDLFITFDSEDTSAQLMSIDWIEFRD